MAQFDNILLSLTEENYLKAILHITDTNPDGAGTNELAAQLDVKPATVNNMVKRLKQKASENNGNRQRESDGFNVIKPTRLFIRRLFRLHYWFCCLFFCHENLLPLIMPLS